jgi:predicted ester cyclase
MSNNIRQQKNDIPPSLKAQGKSCSPGMEGFSPEFRDPEHYIIDITYRIWEERGIDLIRQWYAPDCLVRTPHGLTDSVEPVVAGTAATLEEFPDRQLLPEDIIIGLKEKGFHSSHRVRSTATHRGDGSFGKATGKAITMLTIADCLCLENMIVEEWLVRDQAAMALQLGLDPVAFGTSLGKAAPEKYALPGKVLEARWADPQGFRIEGDEQPARKLIGKLEELWGAGTEAARLSAARDSHDRALRFEGPGGLLSYGREPMTAAVAGITASIPDGQFKVHHAITRRDEESPVRIALRWSYSGTHEGEGRYGKPTSCPLTVLGASHFELRKGKVINEWMLLDDLAMWAQISGWDRA